MTSLVGSRRSGAWAGHTIHLSHHCLAIPADQHARYAPHTVLARPEPALDVHPTGRQSL